MSNHIVDSNRIIRLTRGDSFSMPIVINQGTQMRPIKYTLQDGDKLYIGVMEPNCCWECSIIRKTYDLNSIKDDFGNILFKLSPDETEFLLPGTYYYSVKLLQRRFDEYGTLIQEEVTTIIPKTLFYIQ